MIGAVVLAGGQGKRMQAGINKQYLEIEGRSVLSLAIESMAAAADGLIVVCAHGEEAQARAAVRESGALAERVQIVEGGKERQDSVRNALLAMPESWQKVLIHDGARPFVPQEMLRRILDASSFLADSISCRSCFCVSSNSRRLLCAKYASHPKFWINHEVNQFAVSSVANSTSSCE